MSSRSGISVDQSGFFRYNKLPYRVWVCDLRKLQPGKLYKPEIHESSNKNSHRPIVIALIDPDTGDRLIVESM